MSSSQTPVSTAAAKPMITIRLYGSTAFENTVIPPDIHTGFSTCTFCAPKIIRVACMRIRLIPHVASSVSSGRP